ncbi:STE3-domain-containing protein [Lojkania enalia]|uniref:STE3-domain-containing protein n=1 Tax=Lojkania enalia TaxID=147567 RepID=A0A9P4K4V9_9PLEO|nr:STE3-domain-containing protein [Didymosphaeria enalia]
MTSEELYPIYPTAIIFPALALPAVILDIPPLIWHIWQRNIAAWSLILWLILMNLFNFINALIWPRDNLLKWWNGDGLCDVEVRIFVGSIVALPAAAAMVMRKLARVMDTRNMTVTTNSRTRLKENVLEILWCWGYPIFMMIVYYIIQPIRYYIFSIAGCVVAYHSSWPTAVLSTIWGPITMMVASVYAGILIYRLCIYRHEFRSLLSARRTTKSRFVRLTIMSIFLVVVYVPFSFYIMYDMVRMMGGSYEWSSVHGPGWNSIQKIPTFGSVAYDKWGQVATGYVAFFIFGTGTDANKTYKKMLCAIGLGRLFPSLYNIIESGHTTPSIALSTTRSWFSTCTNKARNLFSKYSSTHNAVDMHTSNTSVADVLTPTTANTECHRLHSVSADDPILQTEFTHSNDSNSFLSRIFTSSNHERSILPLFTRPNVNNLTSNSQSPTRIYQPGGRSYAWVSSNPHATRTQDDDGVHVVQEVTQHSRTKNGKEKDMDGWPGADK